MTPVVQFLLLGGWPGEANGLRTPWVPRLGAQHLSARPWKRVQGPVLGAPEGKMGVWEWGLTRPVLKERSYPKGGLPAIPSPPSGADTGLLPSTALQPGAASLETGLWSFPLLTLFSAVMAGCVFLCDRPSGDSPPHVSPTRGVLSADGWGHGKPGHIAVVVVGGCKERPKSAVSEFCCYFSSFWKQLLSVCCFSCTSLHIGCSFWRSWSFRFTRCHVLSLPCGCKGLLFLWPIHFFSSFSFHGCI